MRYLGVARLRLLTTVRMATPIVVVASIPPLIAAITESVPEPLFRAGADGLLGTFAKGAIFGWFLHAVVIILASEAFGSIGLFRADLTEAPSDLMDSAPIGQLPRFWGEALGVFAATLTIHACCLPLLAAVAILSPLPTVFFVWMEIGIIILMAFGSVGAAWKRLAPRTKWSATRTMRSGVLFLILSFLALYSTTRWASFRDAMSSFITMPSTRTWGSVTASVENPVLLVVLWSMLYLVYLAYYVNSSRKPAQA